MADSEIRALIVDDESALRGILKIALTYFGVKVVGEASNGVEGLKRYRELHPNVVLMDINMPEMDGLTCLTEIRKINPEAVVLLMTASEDEDAMDKGRERGARGFLRKPLVMDELHRDIVNTLRVHFAKEKGVELDKDFQNYSLKPGFRPADQGKHIPPPPASGATRRIREHQLAHHDEDAAEQPGPAIAELSQPNPAANRSTLAYGSKIGIAVRDAVNAQKRVPAAPPAPILATAPAPVAAPKPPAPAPAAVAHTPAVVPTSSAHTSLEDELALVRLELDRRTCEVDELRAKLESATETLRRMADELANK